MESNDGERKVKRRIALRLNVAYRGVTWYGYLALKVLCHAPLFLLDGPFDTLHQLISGHIISITILFVQDEFVALDFLETRLDFSRQAIVVYLCASAAAVVELAIIQEVGQAFAPRCVS